MTRFSMFHALGASVLAAGSAGAGSAEPPIPTALATLQPGQWQLRSLDGSAPAKTLCLGDPRVLLQLRHSNQLCNRLVITNNATQAVVNYSCAGMGNGRTSVRVETPRVIQIESQGIADKAPFDWAYEGRRIGECPVSGPTAQR
jgi:hypothetical protein